MRCNKGRLINLSGSIQSNLISKNKPSFAASSANFCGLLQMDTNGRTVELSSFVYPADY